MTTTKDQLLADLGYEAAERAAILEFDAKMPRQEAERLARFYHDGDGIIREIKEIQPE